MDPLTHTLVGASLAGTSLGRKTQLASPALILGANLPDVDVLAYFWGGDAALGFRRGWTHGVPAVVLLPAVLAAGLWLWARARGGEDESRRLSSGWLLALCYLAVATHPCLDWLNTYGMRWWMPFLDTWSYGDAVFIMDPWLWLLLGCGWLVGRRPTRRLVIGWALVVAALLSLVAGVAPRFLPVVGVVGVLSLLALLWRSPRARRWSPRVATAGLLLAGVYVGSLLFLQGVTERRVYESLQHDGRLPVRELMVGPRPADPLAWEFVARRGDHYRYGRVTWLRRGNPEPPPVDLPAADAARVWSAIRASGQARGFLRWVRFPWLEVDVATGGRRVYLMDARYTRTRTLGFGGTAITLSSESLALPAENR